LISAACCWIVGFLLIGLAPTVAVLVTGTLFYGLADGALIPSLQDTTSRFAPDSHRASVMATWTGCARAGQASGPLVAGAVIAGSGTTAGILTGVACAIGMLAIFALGPIRRLT
jgi:MFS family permease